MTLFFSSAKESSRPFPLFQPRATVLVLPKKEVALADKRREAPRSTDDPDLPAIRKVLEGDSMAYASIVERHEARLRRVITGILADTHLAEDVLQDVFLIAYRRLGSFRQESLFGTWIGRIAAREALSACNRWKKWWRRQMPLDENEPRGQTTMTPPPDQRIADRDEALELLRQLPARERTAFVLHVEGWNYEEIARAMRHPLGTVGTWIHRARARMQSRSERTRAPIISPHQPSVREQES